MSSSYEKEEKKPPKPAYVVLKAIGLILIILVFMLPSIIFPQYKAIATTGKYKVATESYAYTDIKRIETYTDTGENRRLNVKMWFPENTVGQFPLIVFSHGAFGTKTSNTSLCNELASHGYVVCAIDHTYQCLFTAGGDGRKIWMNKSYIKEILNENAHIDKQKSYEFYQKWMKIRTDDISFVIDHLLSEENSNDLNPAYKLIDTTKIGVMGHSLGGSAALGLGRMRDDISAVVALESPFMCDIMGVKDEEFVFTDKIYPVPVLNVYSDQGWDLLHSSPQYTENVALLSVSNAAVCNVHISGVGHLTLTDLALASPFLTRVMNGKKSTTDSVYCLETINKVCLEFFDSYLKGVLHLDFNVGTTIF